MDASFWLINCLQNWLYIMRVPKRVTVIQGVKCMGVSGNQHIGVDDDSLQSLLVV